MPNGTVLLSLVAIPAYFAVCLLVGRLLTQLLANRPEAVSVAGAPLLGAATLGVQLWLYGTARIPWNPITLVLPWLILAWIRRQPLHAALVADWSRLRIEGRAAQALDTFAIVVATLTGILMFTYLLNLITEPLTGFDAISMWFFKAKVFFLSQGLNLSSIGGLGTYQPGDSGPFHVTAGLIRNLDYPPLFSLMVASVYALVGGVHDTLGKGVDFIFIIVAAATVWTSLAPILGRRLAMIFMFLVTAVPTVQTALDNPIDTGYADYGLGVAMLASLANLQRAWSGGQSSTWVLAIVFASIAALLKQEGLLLLVLVMLLAAWRARQLLASPAVVASIGVVSAWEVTASMHGWRAHHLLNDSLASLPSVLPTRAVLIAAYTVMVVIHDGKVLWLAAAYGVSVWLVLRGARSTAGIVLVALTLQFVAYFAVFTLNPGEFVGIVDRLAIQATPGLVLLLGLAIAVPSARSGTPVRSLPRDRRQVVLAEQVGVEVIDRADVRGRELE